MSSGAEEEKPKKETAKLPADLLFDHQAATDDDPFAQVGTTDVEEPTTTKDHESTQGEERGEAEAVVSSGVDLPEDDGPDPFASIGAAPEEDDTAERQEEVISATTGPEETIDVAPPITTISNETPSESLALESSVPGIAQDDEEASHDYLAQLGANPPETKPYKEDSPTTAIPETEEEDLFSKLAEADASAPPPNDEIEKASTPAPSDDREDDVFAQLADQQPEDQAEPETRPLETNEPEYDEFRQLDPDGVESSTPHDETVAPTNFADNHEEDLFSKLGDDREPDFPIGQEDANRDYSALLEEFSGLEEEPLPETASQEASAGQLFGDEPGSSTFDDFTPSTGRDFIQTASGSTTPPDLSVENSFQDDSYAGYEGDLSTRAGGSWLAETPMDDEPFDIQATPGNDTLAEPPTSADSSSPLTFEVPYGWYEGDTFHYYTEEEREQVRLTMLGQAEWPESDTQESVQDAPAVRTASPALQSAYSENAARRTPNPDQYSADPYAPDSSSSRPTPVSLSSYYASQSTSTTATTDPYAPVSSNQTSSSLASPMQVLDPYAPATAAWDPYPAPQSAANSYGSQSQPKSSPLAPSGPKMASTSRPQPPQRVASTAYDPPFLRPQKSFARPVSAAPIVSGLYGLTPSPAPPLPPAPHAAPPPGPPKRSMTPQIAPQPPVAPPPASARVVTPVQYDAYSPSVDPSPVMPPTGPAKGPSRPSSAQPSRPPQRAPSYNAFDPPLRPQTASRPPSRAMQMASSPQPSSGHPTLLSPPTMADSSFPPPARPSSRGVSARPVQSFEPPPPPGPPRRSTPSFQPPPRPSSTASNFAPPPRPPSVSQPVQNASRAPYGEEEEEEEVLASPVRAPNYPIPDLHSGQEEPDEEGGGANWDDVDYPEDRADMPPPQQQQQQFPSSNYEDPSSGVDHPTEESSYGRPETGEVAPHRPPPVQTRSSYDPYAPVASRSPAKSPREAYHPYRRTSTSSPLKARKDGYEPHRPVEEDVSEPRAPQSSTYDPYAPNASQERPSTQVPQYPLSGNMPPNQTSQQPYMVNDDGPSFQPPQPSAYDPYAPSTQQERSTPYSPQQSSSLGLSSLHHNEQSNQNPYGPPIQRSTGYTPDTSQQTDHYTPSAPRSTYDPYAAPQQNDHLRVSSPGYTSDYGTSPPGNNYFSSLNAGPADHTYTPQQVLDQKPLSEDPLGRSTLAARNKPLAIFGFGGVILASFPGMANMDNETLGHSRTPSYGYASGRGQVWIRSISDVVSESALKTSETHFPGPLVLDPTTSKTAANDKKKKEAVLSYLNSRAEEIEKGLPYLKTSANSTRREQEGKLVLIRVLIAMVTGDGKLSGTPESEAALRTALQSPSDSTNPSSTFSPTSVTGPATNGFSSNIYHGANQHAASATAIPAQLAQLSTMLAQGDKRDAALYAASQGLWAHALLASSGVDQEFWREIVHRFTTAEIKSGVPGSAALKTGYTIFAGLDSTSVDELVAAANITDDPSVDQWREVISALTFNGKPADLAYLEELGSRFTSAGLINAGHVCSLLSPKSPFSDMTQAALDRSISLSQNGPAEDSIVFAEVAEFARSLITVPKGQELPFPGLPQLLPYKLYRAWWAAELGENDLAKRYCTAVESASKVGKNGPPLLSRAHLNSLEDLQERLTGEPSIKAANLLGGRKQGSKPGVNKLGSWIEGRLTKFIAGEEDSEGPFKAAPPTKGKEAASGTSTAPVGPFSHFSTISPGPSNPVTRPPSTAGVRNGSQLGVDVDSRRTSPSIGQHKSSSSVSSSAYGGDQYVTRGGGGAGGAGGAGGGGYGGYQPYVPDESSHDRDDDTPHALEPAPGGDDDVELLNPMATLSLGASRQSQNDYAPPPPTTRRDEPEDDEDDLGFGNTGLSRNRTPKPAEGAQTTGKKEDPKKAAPAAAAAASSQPEQKPSGWLRGWFGKKEGEGSGPVVAKLGEESSMVYDTDLKRWVVKGSKPEAAASSAPPPPPRAQTASPSKTARDSQNPRANSATPPPSQLSRSAGPGAGSGSGLPPPPSGLSRNSTASLGFTETADGGIRRQKSSLAESTTPGSMTPPAPPGGGPPRPPSSSSGLPKPTGASLDDLLSRPPSKRPASAARKGVKNRYVDVFQGEGNS